jgi:ribosomal protein S18 acetylase RimI-like enzyme
MTLTIRRANAADAEAIALLGRITFRETFGSLFADHADDLRAYLDHTFAVGKLRASLALPRSAYWVALLDDLPVAYAKLKHPSPTSHLTEQTPAQVQKIYVLREFLHQGIGRPLLHRMLEEAALRQAGAVWLDVLKQNVRAIRIYEQNGFSALGQDTYTIGAQTFTFHLMVLRSH